MASNKEKYLQETQELLRKWEWLLEGVEGKEERINTAMVLESSYKVMIEKGQLPQDWLEKQLNEDEEINEAGAPNSINGTFGNSTVIPRVIFPMIRRVMPDLIANKLVSVQPVQARTGIAYHIDYRYTNAKDGTGGKSFTGHPFSFEGNGVLPRHYSSEKFFAGNPTLGGTTSPLELTSVGGGALSFFKTYGGATMTDAEVAALALDVTRRVEIYYRGIRNRALEEATLVTVSGNNLVITLPAATGDFAAFDAKQVNVFWLYRLEGSKYIPELEFTIGSKTIETHERKLKVRWTAEAEQDMQAYHKIDVEGELVKVASTEMNYEVDREIIDFIEDLIQPELSFAVQFGESRTPAVIAGDPEGTPPVADGSLGVTYDQALGIQGNYLDRHRRLAQLIFQLQAEMTIFNRQGGANWAVISPQVGALLKMLPGFEGEIAGNSLKIQEFGNLSGMQMYVDPNKKDRELVTLGLKTPNSNYGAGVVYSPYHSWMSSVITHPENFDSIRGFFSRYAIDSFERGEWFYAGLTLSGVEYMSGTGGYNADGGNGLRW